MFASNIWSKPFVTACLAVVAMMSGGACSSEPDGSELISQQGEKLEQVIGAGGSSDASTTPTTGGAARAPSTSTTGTNQTTIPACQEIPDNSRICPPTLPMKVLCPSTDFPKDCSPTGELAASAGVTRCCPAGTSLAGGAGATCACGGNLILQNQTGTVLISSKTYIDWWGTSDPNNLDPVLRGFLQNIGGARWLNTVTQYHTSNGNPGNPNTMWGSEWTSTSPPPETGRACTKNADCPSNRCDLTSGKCYCGQNADCASNICNVTSGYCYPSDAQFKAEVDRAVAQFNPPDDGVIFIALPSTVPYPNGYCGRHASEQRSGHKRIAYVEFPYQGLVQPTLCYSGASGVSDAVSAIAMHELAEAITDPRYDEAGGAAWQDSCYCENADKCQGSVLRVGLSATADYGVAQTWSNNAQNGSGACVWAYSTHEDWYVVGNYGGSVGLCHSNWLAPGTWNNYGQPPGVSIASGPGAVSWSNGRQDVFVLGSDGNVWQWRQAPGIPAGWANWGKPPGTVLFGPDAFSWRPQREDVVVVAQNGSGVKEFWKKAYANGTWIDWQNLGAPPVSTINSRPGTASWGPNRFDIFYLSSELPAHIRHAYSTNGTSIAGWDDWGRPTGVTFFGSEDAASSGDQNVNVVVLGNDGNVWQRAWDHSSFYNWFSWGTPGASFDYGVGAVGGGDHRLDLTSMNAISHTFYDRFWNWGLQNWYSDAESFTPYNTIDMSAW